MYIHTALPINRFTAFAKINSSHNRDSHGVRSGEAGRAVAVGIEFDRDPLVPYDGTGGNALEI